jgi:solute carrier family 25 (mitochondrial carnitine/acylcarnitine transporter), member 20/29
LARGMIEIPTDFLKTRRQVEKSWTWSHLMDGTSITLLRNTVLYTAFMVYIDLSKQLCQAGHVPEILMNEQRTGLTPFAKGAICANLAWLTVWPADVIKTQRQSGNYANGQQSTLQLLHHNLQTGRLFRGVIPGLIRSSLANGSSMVVYEWTHTTLSQLLNLQERRDMT